RLPSDVRASALGQRSARRLPTKTGGRGRSGSSVGGPGRPADRRFRAGAGRLSEPVTARWHPQCRDRTLRDFLTSRKVRSTFMQPTAPPITTAGRAESLTRTFPDPEISHALVELGISIDVAAGGSGGRIRGRNFVHRGR